MKALTLLLLPAILTGSLAAAPTATRTPTPRVTPTVTATPVFNEPTYLYLNVPDKWLPGLGDLADATYSVTYSKDGYRAFVRVDGASQATIKRLRTIYSELNPSEYTELVRIYR
jgi:hypothetical protein